jgi:hypothetical protein
MPGFVIGVVAVQHPDAGVSATGATLTFCLRSTMAVSLRAPRLPLGFDQLEGVPVQVHRVPRRGGVVGGPQPGGASNR